MVGNAIAQSAQPIISYNFGLGNAGRIREAESVAIKTALLCGLAVTFVFIGLPEILVGLFVDLRTDAACIAVSGFPYFALGFVFFIFNITAVGYFQSVERVLPATLFALLRGVVFIVPSFIIMPSVAGTCGIWLSMPVAELLTSLSIAVFYFAGRHAKHGVR